MVQLASPALTQALQRTAQISKNTQAISKNMNKGFLSLNKNLKQAEGMMSRMAKTAQLFSTAIKFSALTLAGMAFGKMMSALKSAADQYGSASSNFRAFANKSDSKKDLALQRAFEIQTGDKQDSFINSVGRISANGTISGSESQSLLLQLGIDPKTFQNKSMIERVNQIFDKFSKLGDNVKIRELLESLTGMNGADLEAMIKLWPNIQKEYDLAINRMGGIDSDALLKTDQELKRLKHTFEDFSANIISTIAPHLEKVFKSISSALNGFLQSGGIEKVKRLFESITQWAIKSIPSFIDLLKNSDAVVNSFKVFASILSGIGKIFTTIVNVVKQAINYFELFALYINKFINVITEKLYKFGGFLGLIDKEDYNIAKAESITIDDKIDRKMKAIDKLDADQRAVWSNPQNKPVETQNNIQQVQEVNVNVNVNTSEQYQSTSNPLTKYSGYYLPSQK